MTDAFVQAVFVVGCMTAAGFVHVAWLRSRAASVFRKPLDAGLTWRGRRLFGANKTWAGVMVLPLASAATCALSYALLPAGALARLWPLSAGQAGWLGAALGAAFLLAELPNSFMKRQLDVAPGAAPRRGALAVLLPLVDRLDSPAGVIVALALTVGLNPGLAAWVLVLGLGAHTALSFLMYALRLKPRAL